MKLYLLMLAVLAAFSQTPVCAQVGVQRSEEHRLMAVPGVVGWVEYTLGVLVGASVELAANIANNCIAGVAIIAESAYSIYYYTMQYNTYEEDEDLAWAGTYVIKIVKGFEEVDCSAGIFNAPYEPVDYQTQQTKINDHTLKADTDTNELFNKIYDILGDAQEIVEIIQIYSDSSTVYEEWNDEDYFEAGLYSGKGVVNAYFAAEGIYNAYA